MRLQLRISSLLTVLMLPRLALANCVSATATLDIARAVASAEAAFAAMDLALFKASVEQAKRSVACLDEPVSVFDAGGLHRMTALTHFVAKADEDARRSFRASLSVQPAYKLSSSLAPQGNPLHTLYLEAKASVSGERVPVAVPEEHGLYIDGVRTVDAPASRPMLAQLIHQSGEVVWTAYVQGVAELPSWSVAEEDKKRNKKGGKRGALATTRVWVAWNPY